MAAALLLLGLLPVASGHLVRRQAHAADAARVVTSFFMEAPQTPSDMRLHFVTFGRGVGFDKAEAALCQEAHNMSHWVRFSAVHCFTDVPDAIVASGKWDKHLQFKKGFGLWFWKPAIVQMLLRNMTEGDVLFYVDAASSLHDMPMWKLWLSYFAGGADVLAAQTKYAEKGITKGDVFTLFGVPLHGFEGSSGQIVASYLGLKNSPRTRALVDKWVGLVQDIGLLSDQASVAPNCECFARHMHDQSLLSMLLKANLPESNATARMRVPGLRIARIPFHYGDGTKEWAITSWGEAHYAAHTARGEKVPKVFWDKH